MLFFPLALATFIYIIDLFNVGSFPSAKAIQVPIAHPCHSCPLCMVLNLEALNLVVQLTGRSSRTLSLQLCPGSGPWPLPLLSDSRGKYPRRGRWEAIGRAKGAKVSDGHVSPSAINSHVKDLALEENRCYVSLKAF